MNPPEPVVEVVVEAGSVRLPGLLGVPASARAIVVFAHGSGSSRLSPRNNEVAAFLRATGHFGTLLFDLLKPEEDSVYRTRFDIPLLTERLLAATRWLGTQAPAERLPVGHFGASTGAAAALQASVTMPSVRAVVSRGGRADLAAGLGDVSAPTLLIVGGADGVVLELNRTALAAIGSEHKRLEIVPGATHLFEEPGATEQVARLTRDWFDEYLGT